MSEFTSEQVLGGIVLAYTTHHPVLSALLAWYATAWPADYARLTAVLPTLEFTR